MYQDLMVAQEVASYLHNMFCEGVEEVVEEMLNWEKGDERAESSI